MEGLGPSEVARKTKQKQKTRKTKNTKNELFSQQFSFFFVSFNNKTQKIAETHIFSVLANLKKRLVKIWT